MFFGTFPFVYHMYSKYVKPTNKIQVEDFRKQCLCNEFSFVEKAVSMAFGKDVYLPSLGS